MAIKTIILISLIIAHPTLAQMYESAGVAQARADLTSGGGTSLCRD